MKRFILTLCASALCFGVFAAEPTYPEAGKYYKIKHASGLYLTDGTFNARVTADAGDNSQVVEFIPVEGSEHVYNIKRVRHHNYYGSDLNWNSTIISRPNNDLARFELVPAETEGMFLLKNIGMADKKSKTKCYLGTDDYNSDPKVYTDKDGKNEERHLWAIEECALYEETAEAPEDKYPGKDLAEGDPRADVYPGYKLVFAEEFSKEGKPNGVVWNFETGFMRNEEHQYYHGSRNCYQQDGVLVIEARDVSAEKIKNPKYVKNNNSWPSNIGPYLHWTSGSMTTKGGWNDGYTWLYGIYEVRAKVPQMVGCWPAIWSTGKSHEWPYGGEIDILEYYGGAIHGNVCVGNGGRWGARWNSAIIRDADLGEGWGDEYHTWRMYWDYDHIELWCDDLLVNNIDLDSTQNTVPSDSFDHGNGDNPFRDVRQMLWLNLAIGGQNGGDPYNPPYPNRFLVDYARVYQAYGSDGNATYHVDETVSEPTFTVKDGEWNEKIANAIEEITMTESADCEPVYYNLQGIVLEQPAPGELVICRRGSEVSKFLYK